MNENVQRCYECGGRSVGRRENYPYSECGLKHVVLKDVMVYRCETCGAESAVIPNMDGLHRSLALVVLRKGSLLTADEIRFLRRSAGFTATELAKNLGVTKTAVSRWENGAKISGASDRAIRLFCGLAIVDEIVNERSGAVHPEDVASTLDKLKQFLLQFSPKTANVLASIRDDAHDSEKVFIDPGKAMAGGLLVESKELTSLIQ